MALPRVDSVVFALVAATSAAAVFWFPVLEANSFGALSIMIAITIVAFADRGWRVPEWVCLCASLATLAFTTTNWMVGLLMLGAVLPLKRAAVMAVGTVGVTAILWGLQKMLFPETGILLKLNTAAEIDYLFNPEALGLWQKLVGFLFYSIVLPEISASLSTSGAFAFTHQQSIGSWSQTPLSCRRLSSQR